MGDYGYLDGLEFKDANEFSTTPVPDEDSYASIASSLVGNSKKKNKMNPYLPSVVAQTYAAMEDSWNAREEAATKRIDRAKDAKLAAMQDLMKGPGLLG